MPNPDPGRLAEERGDYECVNQQPLTEESLKNGRRWTFREVLDISADGTIEFHIANDFGADTIRLVAVDIDPDNEIEGFADANVTVDAAGTAFPVRNDRIDADVATPPAGLTVEYGGTYSGGEGQLPLRNSGGVGKGAAKTPIKKIPTANARLRPGANLRYQITEKSGNAGKVTIEIVAARAIRPD